MCFSYLLTLIDSSNVAFLISVIIFYGDKRQDNAIVDSTGENDVSLTVANMSYSLNIS